MRTLIIYFNNGEVLKHNTKGTNPQLQRAFFIGRILGQRQIEALTIEN
tara:strand:- start:281 stop:424 length:144 start_codon:yes stop_codon:yes gene_type:complete